MKHYFFGSYPLLPPSIGREGDLDRYLLRMKGKEGDWKGGPYLILMIGRFAKNDLGSKSG